MPVTIDDIRAAAEALLERAGGNVKTALVMGRLDVDRESAVQRLKDVDGATTRLLEGLEQ